MVTATSPTSATPASRIAFVLGSETSFLYTATPDGSDAHALTDFGVEDPDWSPDGSMIAFNSERAGHSHVFVINADGTGLRQITSGDGYEGHPGWSPDGKDLAVDRAGPSREHEGIHILSVADGTITRITTNP